jgi:histidinol-phosphate aminotransferase
MKPGLPAGLGRACYADIDLYDPGRKPTPVDLSDNTNLYGIPPNAERALRDVGPSVITRYPSVYANELKAALATYVGVPESCVTTGCGSDDVLDSAIRAFTEPGDTIASSDPTFTVIPLFGRMNGLRAVQVPLTADHQVDADALLATGAKVIYLCSPNNPTGMSVPPETVRRILARAKGVVILDEAYGEYMATPGFAGTAHEHERLLVVKTLSKAFGLGGLRVGYALGQEALVREVEKSRGPYKVGGLAERVAVTALRQDVEWVKDRIRDVLAIREQTRRDLAAMGFTALPSDANFLLVPIAQAKDVAMKMRSLGVQVRPFTQLHGMGDALRISIGPPAMMERALDALRKATS